MTRTRYIVTFPAARPGDEVTWPNTVKVYADADAQVPLQSGQSVDESLTFSGWSDAASVVFSRPAGDGDTVTVTSGSPSGTGAAKPSSGGSSPVGATLRRAEYHSDGQLVDGNFGAWSYALNPGGSGGDDGDQPLDLTDPQNPTIRTAGIYAISATVRSDDVHAGKHWRLFLSPDDENFGWMASASTPLDSAGTVGIWLNVSITNWLPAGATVPLYFFHDVGSPAAFTARIAVQRLTLD